MAGLISSALKALTGAGGVDAFAELERLRSSILTAQTEIVRLTGLPIPRADAEAVVDARLAQLSMDAAKALGLAVAKMIRPDGAPGFLSDLTHEEQTALTVYVAPQVVRAQIGKILDEEYSGLKSIPTMVARKKRIDELQASMMAEELAEEGIVRRLEAAGLPILRRRDADPRAVLAKIAE